MTTNGWYNVLMIKAVWDSKLHNDFENVFDCLLAESLISEGKLVTTLEETLLGYGAANIEELAEKQMECLKANPKLLHLYQNIELPLAHVLFKMQQRGILLDTVKLAKLGKELDADIERMKAEIAKSTGDININSSAQLGEFLAKNLKVPLGKTKTGKFATNEGELSKFREKYPLINNILSYREKSKLRSTYIESLSEKADSMGRVHTVYSQVGAATGRLSSSHPNMQNIPVTSEAGLKVKSCFIAAPGYSLVSFDYSQQELRVLAHLSNEPALIEAFKNNLDVHVVTASKLFHVPYSEVSKAQRTIGKTVNFGIIYGMSGYGMSAGLNIPIEEAETFIDEFYLSYPKIKTFYDAYFSSAVKNRFVETLFGRRRFVFDPPNKKFIDNVTRRILLNYPIQGTAADLMKKAMVDVNNKVLKKHSDVHLLLQIHDDLVFEIPDKDNDFFTKVIEEIKKVMCSVWPLVVPLTVDIKIGKNWGEMNLLPNM